MFVLMNGVFVAVPLRCQSSAILLAEDCHPVGRALPTVWQKSADGLALPLTREVLLYLH